MKKAQKPRDLTHAEVRAIEEMEANAARFSVSILKAVGIRGNEFAPKIAAMVKEAAAIIAASCVCLVVAHAAPPPDVDLNSPRHLWFEAQHSVTGTWCCNISDGHVLADTEWRQGATAYEVRIDGSWVPVPSDALRDPAGGPNITGQAIVWYTNNGAGLRIWCFAPGTMY